MENNVDYAAIGKQIVKYREERNMTQDKLAEKTGLSTNYISVIENAHSKASLSTVINIANALGVTLDMLLQDNIENDRPIHIEEIDRELSDCTPDEVRFLAKMIKHLKNTYREHSSK